MSLSLRPLTRPTPRTRRLTILGCIGLILATLTTLIQPVILAQAVASGVRLPVLMYHYISTPPNPLDRARNNLSIVPDLFDQQMKALSSHGYVAVTANQVASVLAGGGLLPIHAILITFDDGYSDAYTNAYPILKKYHMVGTFFVVTDWLDQNKPGYISWNQALDMAANGMSIEGHSRTHDTLVGSNLVWLRSEIDDSLTDIQKQIGIHPTLFAYPFGRYDDNTLAIMKGSGATAAFTTAPGGASSASNLFTEPRLRVSGGMTASGLTAILHKMGF